MNKKATSGLRKRKKTNLSFFQGTIFGLLFVVILGIAFASNGGTSPGNSVGGDVTSNETIKDSTGATRPIHRLDYKDSGNELSAGEFNKLIKTVAEGPAFVGVSAPTDGTPGAGGYAAADALCDTAKPKSRVCSSSEVIRAVASGRLPSPLGVPQVWMNEGPPGYFAPVKDCDGWNSNGSAEYGSIYSFFLGKALVTECNKNIPFACCR